MKLLLKLLLGVIGIVVLGLLLLIAAVALFVDPNDYRDEIARAIQDQTGRELSIEGELSLGLLPCCAIDLGRTSLSNPPGFDDEGFARVESARLGLQLWPLLRRRELRVAELALAGLDVNLLRRADGKANWEFDSDPDAADAADETDRQDDEDAGLADLSIAGIVISDARLRLRDVPAGTDYRVENLNLSTGRLEPGKPFDLDGGLAVTDGVSGARADLTVSAELSFDAQAQQVRAEGLDLAAQGNAPDLGDFELEIGAAALALGYAGTPSAELTGLTARLKTSGAELGQAELELTAPELRAVLDEQTTADLRGVEARLSLAGGEALGADGRLKADLATPQLRVVSAEALQARLEKPALNFDVSSSQLPGGKARGSAQLASLDYAGASGAIDLKDLAAKLQAAGAAVTLTGSGRYLAGGTRLAGRFELPEVAPRVVLKDLAFEVPETADPGVLGRLAASGDWRLGDDQIAFSALAVQLDDTRITGELGASNFERPRLRVDLSVDELDLDRYVAPEDGDEKAQGAADQAQGEDDLKSLRDLNLDGKLRIGRLKVADLRLEDLSAQLSAADGIIRLDPSSARLYGGTYSGRLTLDVSGDDLKLDLDQSLAGVQSGGLLGDFAEVTELQGLMAASIKASGRGASQDELLHNLQGDLSFDLADGVYQGMDIWQEIRKARALIRRKPPPAATGPRETRINALKLDGRLQDGVLRSERMIGEIPFLRLSGRGSVNVISQALDYNFQARVFETPTFADGETYDDLLNVSIPLTIGGTVEAPKIGVDLANLLKDVAVQKATEKLLDRLGLGEPKKGSAPAPGSAEGQGQDAAPGPDQPADAPPAEAQPAEEESPRDALRRSLRDLLQR